ncbi:RNA 3'-terminal phosphate cyclase [Methanohalophilus halophilus]|uniref:RNA 3'-terminal phosphate cyclase n=1 Tax=Methanohalophilus halophilus TaxID=2177 RepID=A0A1L3Q3U4_9EURY|nr:RNA 3'-terminal phosphate cyclase [Methanohalophilus halophilus]APH39451.1 RNA 3'-terminal-phosphate cyclase [Methanohalophilus halophilus]RNI07740.1 RNA 3'-terminal phosphate cyclase [Methanohalophilus halophilus]SDW98277.1 RNA 3'-terminal phosphate cyclase (ATP) [Methanohalophilus halophilus]
MTDRILVDGSTGEGGGQIIRTSVALSAVTGIPVKIINIRAQRKVPGLRAQHVAGIMAVAQLCNAEVRGVSVSSTEIEFVPGPIISDHIKIQIPTAGSIGLVLQALLIPMALADQEIQISIHGGATYGKWSPPIAYIQHVLCPCLSRMGFNVTIRVLREGYYPRGGAQVLVKVEPPKDGIKAIDLYERGKLLEIKGVAHSSSDLERADVSAREVDAIQDYLAQRYDVRINIDAQYSPSYSTGSGVTLWAVFENCIIGMDSLGERGVRAEYVGIVAAENLSRCINAGATVDEFMCDQVIPYMALATGQSRFKVKSVTSHARTNMDIVQRFLKVKFSVLKEQNLWAVLVQPLNC